MNSLLQNGIDLPSLYYIEDILYLKKMCFIPTTFNTQRDAVLQYYVTIFYKNRPVLYVNSCLFYQNEAFYLYRTMPLIEIGSCGMSTYYIVTSLQPSHKVEKVNNYKLIKVLHSPLSQSLA